MSVVLKLVECCSHPGRACTSQASLWGGTPRAAAGGQAGGQAWQRPGPPGHPAGAMPWRYSSGGHLVSFLYFCPSFFLSVCLSVCLSPLFLSFFLFVSLSPLVLSSFVSSLSFSSLSFSSGSHTHVTVRDSSDSNTVSNSDSYNGSCSCSHRKRHCDHLP